MSVAVVIPCHSYPEYLPDAVHSVCGQTVDIGDPVIVLDYPKEQQKYEEFGHEHWFCKNRGVSAARNVGFPIARLRGCDWVIPLDEDDKLLPNAVEKFLLAAELCPDVGIWYSDWFEFGDLGLIPTRPDHCPPEYSFENLLKGPYIPATAMIRIDVWERVREKNGQGYDESLHGLGLRWEDYLFYLEAGLLGVKMARVGATLFAVRKHGVSGSTLANATIPQWREYASRKLGIDL